MGETMKINTILAALIAMILLASTASAYVPEKYRTSEHMTDYEIVKVALAVHDESNDWNNSTQTASNIVYVPTNAPRWANDIIEDAEIHHTNSGRGRNNHAQLRLWLMKIELQNEKKLEPIRGDPENLVMPELPGWCSGYDKRCQKKVN